MTADSVHPLLEQRQRQEARFGDLLSGDAELALDLYKILFIKHRRTNSVLWHVLTEESVRHAEDAGRTEQEVAEFVGRLEQSFLLTQKSLDIRPTS